jgi:hypothetical protein
MASFLSSEPVRKVVHISIAHSSRTSRLLFVLEHQNVGVWSHLAIPFFLQAPEH